MVRYARYVAIGDSQTEGLWDGDDETGVRGFADRLAEMLDAQHPGLCYANLAIRGKCVADVLDHQLPQALSMKPDLVTVCVGMNDVTRPGRHFDKALADLAVLYFRLAHCGATVVTTTFPDPTSVLPVGRIIAERIGQINEAIEKAAAHYDFKLIDLYGADSMRESDTWSNDRVHGSPRGHALFAAAAAEALGLPSSNHDWASAADGASPATRTTRAVWQLQWTKNMLAPWLWHTVRGVSSGDGREPKRPRMEPLEPQDRQRERRVAGSDL